MRKYRLRDAFLLGHLLYNWLCALRIRPLTNNGECWSEVIVAQMVHTNVYTRNLVLANFLLLIGMLILDFYHEAECLRCHHHLLEITATVH